MKTIMVAVNVGDKELRRAELPAYIRGPLAVHRSFGINEDYTVYPTNMHWRVAHVKSGKLLCTTIHRVKAFEAIKEFLATDVDFTHEEVPLTPEQKAVVNAIAKKYMWE